MNEITLLDEQKESDKTAAKIDHILALVRDYGAVMRVSGVGFEAIRSYKAVEGALKELANDRS